MSNRQIDNIIYNIILSRITPNAQLKSMLPEKDIRWLLEQTEELLSKEPILVRVDAGIQVVGDLHGNVDDLLRIFDMKGYPPQTNYMFLGDYVDRGHSALEIVVLLFALKLKYPEHIHMIRGNHETEQISEYYGFYAEVDRKYDGSLFYHFHTVFKQLPLASVIGSKVFCVHGGISPKLPLLTEFEKMAKPEEIDAPSLFLDLVWSDPMDIEPPFAPNDRGCGQFYGQKALDKFLDNNGLQLLLRSHEMCEHGYFYPYKNSERCLTIFSSTDYCGRTNKGCVLTISKSLDVDVDVFMTLTPEEKKTRRVVFPPWLSHLMVEEVSSKVDMMKIPAEPDPNSEIDLFKNREKSSMMLSHEENQMIVHDLL